MDNILKQIQEATEKFDSLFEVDGDGLGNPAMDVPPSTNKLRKDIKTKNGKVELVSVEDELFPKEGNAKEQFKQKVLDKINAMIQGTGTLEDLLNVVRAKQLKPVKEGFEGAIEILEDLFSQIEKVHGEPKYHKETGEPINKSAKLTSKALDNDAREFQKAMDKNGVGVYDRRHSNKNLEGSSKTMKRRDKQQGELFEGAIKLLENIIAERKYSEEEIREIAKKVRPERVDKFNKACGELDKVTQGKNPDKFSAVQKYRANKAAEKVERTQDRLNRVDDIINPAVKTPIGIKRANESFSQAISQIEGLIRCLGESSYTEDTVNKVAKKVFPQRKEEAEKAHTRLNHAMNINPYSMLGGKLSKKQQELITKALDRANRADDKLAHVNDILNKSKKESKLDGIKFDKILCNYEEAIEILEGLFVKDGRGDFIDDVSKTLTKKPVMKHVQDFTKKLLKPKEKSEK